MCVRLVEKSNRTEDDEGRVVMMPMTMWTLSNAGNASKDVVLLNK